MLKMEQETAVEWFAKEIIKKYNISLFEHPDVYEKAREMEIKQQERMYSEEEAKQETQGYICPQTKKQCDDECCVSAEDCHIEASFGIISDCEPPKQETISEGFHRISKEFDYSEFDFVSFKIGAKWQQEQDKNKYSEEEVKQAYCEGAAEVSRYYDNGPFIDKNEWFKQFKNK